MKRIKFLFILILSLFLFACEDTNKEKDWIKITTDKTTIAAGEELYLTVTSSKLGNYLYESSDEKIAFVDEFGFVSGVKEGTATITVTLEADQSLKSSIEITITKMTLNNIKVNGNTMGHVGDVLDLKYTQYPRGMDETLSFTSSDTNIASVDQDGKVTLNAIGQANITITSENGYTQTFVVGAFDFSSLVVSNNDKDEYQDGEKITYNNKDYYYNYTYLKSLKDACKYIDENGSIYVLEGTYEEDFIISKNGVKLIGPSKAYLVDLSSSSIIINDAIITGTLVVNNDLNDIEISGLTFKGEGFINIYGHSNNLLIENNKFEESSLSAEWSKINSQSLIFFKSNNNPSNNVNIRNNAFLGSNVTCITLSYVLNLKITGNYFVDFALDAIKSNLNETLGSCQWLIRNNVFMNGGYNAIYFPSFGAKVISYEQLISIFDNKFDNIGNDNRNIFDNPYGAISICGYNGGTTSVVARYNEFNNCASLVRVDNEQSETYFNNLDVYANYNKVVVKDNIDYLFESFKEVNSNKNTKTLNESFINAKNNLYLNETGSVIDLSSKSTNTDVKTSINLNEFENNRIYANNVLHIDTNSKIISDVENITYQSQNPTVLTVSANGELKPVAEGDAIVVAYLNGSEVSRYEFKVKGSINVDYASLLVSIALKEEGYVEGSNNYTKYGVWYSEQVSDNSFAHGAWCAMFVSWCSHQANIPRTIIPLYASCAAGRQWFETRGLFKYKESYTPKTGDIIFFLSNGASHTGIVVTYKNGTVYTIEGNTSDMCHQRSYDPMNARITGYGTPEYPIFTGEAVEFDISSATSGEGHSTR